MRGVSGGIGGGVPGGAPGGGRSRAGLDLAGGLACAGCRYPLAGLSVRAACPECGLPVKATLLRAVDPAASELVPLRRPRLVAGAMLAWAGGGLFAALCVWWLRASQLASEAFGWACCDFSAHAPPAMLAGVAVSGVGAAGLVRPHAGLGRGAVIGAAGAALLYVPLGVLLYSIHAVHDPRHATPYASLASADAVRPVLRLAVGACVAGVLLGLRANVVRLVNRNVLMRTGQVPTQPIESLLIALGVAAAGDGLMLAGPGLLGSAWGAAASVGMVLIGVGSLLVTLGLGGLAGDAARLWATLSRRPLGLADVLADPAGADVGRGGGGASR